MRPGIITSTESSSAGCPRKEVKMLTEAYRAQADEYDSECDKKRASGTGDSVAESLEGLEVSEYNARAYHGQKQKVIQRAQHCMSLLVLIMMASRRRCWNQESSVIAWRRCNLRMLEKKYFP
jgi:hypothetical protein